MFATAKTLPLIQGSEVMFKEVFDLRGREWIEVVRWISTGMKIMNNVD